MISRIVSAILALGFCAVWAAELHAAEVVAADSVRKYAFFAKTARQKEQYQDAAGYYAEYLKYRPDDVQARYRLGQMYFMDRQLTQARSALAQVVTLDSLHVNANILLYNLYLNADLADSAAQCLERVLQVRPDDVEKRRSLGDLYRREGRIEDAIRHYEVLVSQVDDPEELVEMVALLYEDLGDAEQALAWRQRLMAHGGDSEVADQREALETMVRLQLDTGDVASAYESLLQLARIDTANRYSYYSRIATLGEEHNDAARIIQGWEGMVKANPRDLSTVAQLVEWYMNEERDDLAAQWLRRGLAVDEAQAHLQLLNGDLLAASGDEEGALAAFEVAKADPRWETIAQQRIWQIRPPETEEEKLRRAFFGSQNSDDGGDSGN